MKEAGRELDALVALHVMNDVYKTEGKWEGYWHTPGLDGHVSTDDGGSYHYSTEIKDAWRIVEKFTEVCSHHVLCQSISPKGWWFEYRIKDGMVRCWAETAPHAICLTMLHVKERM